MATSESLAQNQSLLMETIIDPHEYKYEDMTKLSWNWQKGFCQRFPELKNKNPEKTSLARAMSISERVKEF